MFKRPGGLITQCDYRVLFNVKSQKHNWVAPRGHDTGIKIWCRKSKNKVPLIFPNKHLVKWYICGPTVYDVSHIGHASCYIRFDIINRILREFFDITPVVALGITDVDDKIIKQANKKGVDFRVFAKQYELEFLNNLNEFNILPPAFLLRVTEHIPDIIQFISKIIDKGDAYIAEEDGSVYYNLSEEDGLSPEEVSLQPGQKHHTDFALWKGVKLGEPYWESPWGKGRPGWHIECSAMASKVFGSQLDLHGGGIDLEFPHHKNEEIQSCSFHGCQQWVSYWMYAGQLELQAEKMSKSLNNFVSIQDFLNSNTPDSFRMFCFISSYSKALHYGPDAMSLPTITCDLITKFLADSRSYVRGNWTLGNLSESVLLQELEETKRKVRECLEDDFNTGQCHVALMELVRKTVKALNERVEGSSGRCPAAVHAVSQFVRQTYNSFGFRLGSTEVSDTSTDERLLESVLDQVIDFRGRVRAEALESREAPVKKNLLRACDSFRESLGSLGVVIKDQHKDKSSWSFALAQKKTAESGG